MIDIYFKKCCPSCNTLDLDYEQTSGLGELVTVISCGHACVCGKYNAEPEEETPPQDVTVKGFCDADG
ncbi:MAG: hypothetical protein IJZ39_04430 [Oscillospiraceae bacterium]|nr:hypothetical protein [Oscillospiraceae bacterium]